MEYNVYCDESCHLENDNEPVMAIGAVYLPKEKKKEVCRRINDIKNKYGIPQNAEIKWTKISNNKIEVYKDVINYFFDDDDLHFRCIIADKTHLNHSKFHQTHDEWYYKMYFDMLKIILDPQSSYNVYIDIKDSHSHEKAEQLNIVLCNSQFDFSRSIIKKVQPIRSEEVQIMQITDILTGALCMCNRHKTLSEIQNVSKTEIINLIQKRSGYSLRQATLYASSKVNIFKWDSNHL